MTSAKSFYKKESVSVSAPCNFVRQAKMLLQETKEKKAAIANILGSNAPNPERTAEYYDLIDATVKDRDVLEILNMKNLLRENLEIADLEARAMVHKKMSNKTQPASESQNNQNTVPKVTIAKVSSSGVTDKSKAWKKVPSKNIKSLVGSATQTKSSIVKNENTSEQKIAQPYKSDTEYNIKEEEKTKVPIVFSEEFTSRVKKICPRISSDLLSEETKPATCAIPLSLPNRQKPSTLTAKHEPVYFQGNEMNKGINAVPLNVAFTEINCCGRPHRKKLVIQKLPSINIFGNEISTPPVRSNNQLLSYRTSPHMRKNSFEPKGSERLLHDSSEISECASQQSLPDNTSEKFQRAEFEPVEIDSRTRLIMSRLANALRKCKEKRESQSCASLRNLPVFSPSQDFPKDNECKKEFQNLFLNKEINSSPVKKIDVGTQITKDLENEKMNISVIAQTSQQLHGHEEKCHQTSFPLNTLDAAAQTDIQGLVATGVRIVCDSGVPEHHDCSLMHEATKQEFDNIRCSTPVENIHKTNGSSKNSVLNEDNDKLAVSVIDVGTDIIGLDETMESHPEQCNIGIQTSPMNHTGIENKDCQTSPNRGISCGTMTIDTEQQHIAVQFEHIVDNNSLLQDSKPAVAEVGTQSDRISMNKKNIAVSTNTNVSELDCSSSTERSASRPLNLQFLSLLENLHSVVQSSSSESNGNIESGNENILSEGEIPASILQGLQMIELSSTFDSSLYSSSTSAGNTMLDLVPEKLVPDSSTAKPSDVRNYAHFTSANSQAVNPTFSRSSNELSSSFGGRQLLSEGEVIMLSGTCLTLQNSSLDSQSINNQS